MKKDFVVLGLGIVFLFFSRVAHSESLALECAGLFESVGVSREIKPRYFSVKDPDQFQETELRQLAKELQSFEDYLQKVRLVDDLFEGYQNGSKRSAYRYVANKITPLLDIFLKKLQVQYKMETTRNLENGEIDTHFLILEPTVSQLREGQYGALNLLARDFLANGRFLIAINPFDLVRKTQGTARFAGDGLTYYSPSLRLFVNLAKQFRIFRTEDADYSEDPELASVIASARDKTQSSHDDILEKLRDTPQKRKGSPGWLPPRF